METLRGSSERFHLHRLRDRNLEQFQDRWRDLQMGDGFLCVALPMTIGWDDEQWHFTLLKCNPTMVPIAINPMIARDKDGVTTLSPFHQ